MAKFVKPELFTRFNPPPDVTLECLDASLTQQQYADETDLNKIMEKYAAGMGTIPTTDRIPLYGDFSNVPDFASAFALVQDAQGKFDSLPSKVRERFRNDPQELFNFLGDERNRQEAVELGLIPSKQQDGGAVIGGGIAAVADNKPSVSGSQDPVA